MLSDNKILLGLGPALNAKRGRKKSAFKWDFRPKVNTYAHIIYICIYARVKTIVWKEEKKNMLQIQLRFIGQASAAGNDGKVFSVHCVQL